MKKLIAKKSKKHLIIEQTSAPSPQLSEWNRREFVKKLGASSLLYAFPFSWLPKGMFDQSDFIKAGLMKDLPPEIKFIKNQTGDGIIGPYGEVKMIKAENKALPVFIAASGGLAVADMTSRSSSIIIGKRTDSTAIKLTSGGVQFSNEKIKPWSGATVKQLVKELVTDRQKGRGAVLLRSALHTSYPVMLKQFNLKTPTVYGAAMKKSSRGLGADAVSGCTSQTKVIPEHTITTIVEEWKSAEQQFQECYDKEVGNRSGCGSLGLGADVCAKSYCLTKGFVDLLVKVTEIVTVIAEQVITQTICPIITFVGNIKPSEWPNPFETYVNPVLSGVNAVVGKSAVLGTSQVKEGLAFVNSIGKIFGPYGDCLLKGDWSINRLDTKMNIGDRIVLPYGVKVCISSECAHKLALGNLYGEFATAWGAALGALAALSPEFAASVSALGITATPAVLTAASSMGEGALIVATVVTSLVLLILYYGTVISAQLSLQEQLTTNFKDGKVCIEHPTFALALIQILTAGNLPSALIPPIVTG